MEQVPTSAVMRLRALLNEVGHVLDNAIPTENQANPMPQPSPQPGNLTGNNPIASSSIPLSRESVTPRSSIINEVRRLYTPYERHHTSSLRLAGRSAGRGRLRSTSSGSATGTPSSPWTARFYCLASPNDTRTPSSNMRQALDHNQLGHSVITLGTQQQQSAI